MAIEVVRKKQSAEGAQVSVATEGATATAGNLLIAFAAQTASTAQITFSDDKGSSGWTNHATSCESGGGVNSGWLGYKVAAGGEKEIKAEKGAGGTVQGVTYIEVKGAGTTVDSIQKKDNTATGKEHTTAALTTTDAEEIIFAGVAGPAANTNTIEAWTGTGVLNNVGTASTRCFGGYFVTSSKWTANTATAHWTTSRVSGSLIVAFKAESTVAKGKATGTLLLTGTAKGTAIQKVSGKATGTVLLTGTAKGLAVQVVSGKATGTLLLTGTATGALKAVVQGKATGTLLLGGASSGVAVQVVSGKATGVFLLTGTAKGSVAGAVFGKATGTILFTGTAKGTATQKVLGKATGVLLLTGRSHGTKKEEGAVTRNTVIFIFED